MEKPSSTPEARDDSEVSLVAIFRTLIAHRRVVASVVGWVTTIVASGAGGYFLFLQPERSESVVTFRLNFDSARAGGYPNGLAFSSADIVQAAGVPAAFAELGGDDYCSFGQFRSGLIVDRRSPRRRQLELQYESQLANRLITPVERQRLEDEWAAQLNALPLEMRLVFVAPPACADMPDSLVRTMLGRVLDAWARESDEQRGVFVHRVPLHGPSSFDVAGGDAPLFERVEMTRTALRRLAQSAAEVAQLPGADALRTPEGEGAVAILAKLEDLLEGTMPALMIGVIRSGLASDSLAWLQESVEQARLEERLADDRAAIYREALREFSGAVQSSASSGQPSQRSSVPAEGQTTIPQFDSSLVDRIVELSEQTSEYRQKLTEGLIAAGQDGATAAADRAYFMRLYDLARSGGARQERREEMEARLGAVAESGRQIAALLAAFHEQLSRVGLRPQTVMYEVLDSWHQISRPFTVSDALTWVAAAFLISLVLTAVAVIIRVRFAAP